MQVIGSLDRWCALFVVGLTQDLGIYNIADGHNTLADTAFKEHLLYITKYNEVFCKDLAG